MEQDTGYDNNKYYQDNMDNTNHIEDTKKIKEIILLNHQDKSDSNRSHDIKQEILHNEMELSSDIHNASSYHKVLDVFVLRRNEFDLSNYVDMLFAFKNFIRKKEMSPSVVDEDQRYHSFLEVLHTISSTMYGTNLISLLAFLDAMDTPATLPLLETTLQMARHQLGQFTVKQLWFLQFVLRKRRIKSKVGYDISKRIPQLLETRLDESLLGDAAASDIILALTVCIQARRFPAAHKFVQLLYEYETGLKNVNLNFQLKAIRALLELHRPSNSATVPHTQKLIRDVLLKKALRNVANNITKLRIQTVRRYFIYLRRSCLIGDECAHYQPLLTGYADMLVQDRTASVQDMAVILCWMMEQSLVLYEPLLLRLFQLIQRSTVAQVNTGLLYPLPLIQAIACLQPSPWQQHNVDAVLHKLLQNDLIKDSLQQSSTAMSPLPLTRLGLDLVCLGFFEPSVMAAIAQHGAARIARIVHRQDVAPTYKERLECRQFFLLWKSLQKLDPAHHPLPEVAARLLLAVEAMMRRMANRRDVSNRAVLCRALGCEEALVTGAYTASYVTVDHVVVVGEDGHLVPQPSSSARGAVCIDALSRPPRSKLFAILEEWTYDYYNNGLLPRPQLAVRNRLLEEAGLTVVSIMKSDLEAGDCGQQLAVETFQKHAII